MAGPARPRAALNKLRQRTRDCEKKLVGIVSAAAAGHEEFDAFHQPRGPDVAAIRSTLEPGSMIVEYYRARGAMYACLLRRNGLEVAPVCRADDARAALELLRFQLATLRLGPDYTRRFERPDCHDGGPICARYDLLIRPVRHRLEASHFIFVPHEFPHYVPSTRFRAVPTA